MLDAGKRDDERYFVSNDWKNYTNQDVLSLFRYWRRSPLRSGTLLEEEIVTGYLWIESTLTRETSL